jgi:sodium/hydrogen exchanger 3
MYDHVVPGSFSPLLLEDILSNVFLFFSPQELSATLGWSTTMVSETLLEVLGLIILSILVKMAYNWLVSIGIKINWVLTESVIQIAAGVVIGGIIRGIGTSENNLNLVFNTELYYFFLLPMFFLEAAYTADLRFFYHNITPILLYAFLLTFLTSMTVGMLFIFNCLSLGFSLWGFSFSNLFNLHYSLPILLTFAAALSANESLAIISVISELRVNLKLRTVVLGEQLLNDPVATVMFIVFSALISTPVSFIMQLLIFFKTFNAEFFGLAVAKFAVVLFGGVLVGAVTGIIGSFLTRFSSHAHAIEPVFIGAIGFVSFALADSLYFSGFISIFVCGAIMNAYTRYNIGRPSYNSTRQLLLGIAQVTEGILFIELGIALVVHNHHFDWGLIISLALFLIVWRFILVFLVTAIYNYIALYRRKKDRIPFRDQFILGYSGIRGAIAFVLTLLIFPTDELQKLTTEETDIRNSLITAVLLIIVATVFIQGGTVRPLVKLLRIKTEKSLMKDTLEKDLKEPNDDIRLSDFYFGLPVGFIRDVIHKLQTTEDTECSRASLKTIMQHVKVLHKQLRSLNGRFHLGSNSKFEDPRTLKRRFMVSEYVRTAWYDHLSKCDIFKEEILSEPIKKAMEVVNGTPTRTSIIGRKSIEITNESKSDPIIDALFHYQVIEQLPPPIAKRRLFKKNPPASHVITIPNQIRVSEWANDREYLYFIVRVLHEESYRFWRDRMLECFKKLPDSRDECVRLLEILEKEVEKNEERRKASVYKDSAIQILGSLGLDKISDIIHAIVDKPYVTHPSRILRRVENILHPIRRSIFNIMVRPLNREEISVLRSLNVLQRPDKTFEREKNVLKGKERRLRYRIFWDNMRKISMNALMRAHINPRINMMRIVGSEQETSRKYEDLLGGTFNSGFGATDEDISEVDDYGDLALNELIEELEDEENETENPANHQVIISSES